MVKSAWGFNVCLTHRCPPTHSIPYRVRRTQCPFGESGDTTEFEVLQQGHPDILQNVCHMVVFSNMAGTDG